MRVAFAGSADVSAAHLEALYQAPGIDIVGVITQPDRPAGRHNRFTPCHCKQRAVALGLTTLHTPLKINDPASLATIASWRPDILVVVAYGQFLGDTLLQLPPLGCVNIHLSLLPLLRGAAPVKWAIANGLATTGVTAIMMDRGMDSGDILGQLQTDIAPDETSATLYARLNQMGASLLLRILPAMRAGMIRRTPQDHTAATFAPKLKKIHGHIQWHDLDAADIERRIRAFAPWPGCDTWLDHKKRTIRMKLLNAKVLPDTPCDGIPPPPGFVIRTTPQGPVIRCRRGNLLILRAKPEGAHHDISGHDLICGHWVQQHTLLSREYAGEMKSEK